jgi:hypothetical protein
MNKTLTPNPHHLTPLKYAFKIFLVHRLLVSLIGVAMTFYLVMSGAGVADIYLGTEYEKNRIYAVPPELKVPTDGVGLFLISPFQRWDAEHYLTIAARGYGYDPALVSFPPLFSILTGLLGRLLFGQFLLASLIVSNVCYFLTLYLLYLLTARRWGDLAAQNTCKWLAFFPTALFFMMPYSESLYLTLVLAAFYFCEDERWLIGCFMGVLAGLTRLQGVILVLPMLIIYFKKYSSPQRHKDTEKKEGSDQWSVVSDQRNAENHPQNGGIFRLILHPSSFILHPSSFILRSWRWRWALIPILLIPAGFLGYQVYVYFFPPFPTNNVISNLNNYFFVRVATPFETLFWAVVRPFQAFANGEAILNLWNFSDILGFIMIIWALWVGRKQLPAEYQMYAWATVFVLLTRTGVNFSLVSMLRYVVTIFPAFMVIGIGLAQNRFPRLKRNRRLILTLSTLFQLMFIIFFIVWFWAG